MIMADEQGWLVSLVRSLSLVLCVYLSPKYTPSQHQGTKRTIASAMGRKANGQAEGGETASQPNSIFKIQRGDEDDDDE